MKLWIDDVRPAPDGWVWAVSVHEAKVYCCQHISPNKILFIEEMSLDHDSGDFNYQGGDYVELLKWLEEKQHIEDWKIPTKFHLHTANPVGAANMRAIIERNNWKEILY